MAVQVILPSDNVAQWQSKENINFALAIYRETTSRTIFVSTAGNDTTGDGSVGLPFLTIDKALSTINKYINFGITIDIDIDTGTYAGFTCEGFIGGGNIDVNSSDNAVTVTSAVTVTMCESLVGIRTIVSTDTAGAAALIIDNCQNVTVNSFDTVTNSANSGIFVRQNSYARLNTCDINDRGIAIEAATGGKVFSNNNANSGTINVIGLQSESAGFIAKNGSQPSGTTPEQEATGGQILP